MDTLELWEKEINSNNQLIEEATKISEEELDSKIASIYCHMVKYKYCDRHQGSDWVGTVSNGVKYISDNDGKISTSVRNNINIDKAKRKGFKKAISEVEDHNQKLTISKIEDADIPFNTFKDFENVSKAKQWLKANVKEDMPSCYYKVKKELDKL